MAEAMYFAPSSNHYGRAKRDPKWRHSEGDTLELIGFKNCRIQLVRGRWVSVRKRKG